MAADGVVSFRGLLERLVPTADLVIGAVLTPTPGPHPGGRGHGAADAPGSVIVDVAIDQGATLHQPGNHPPRPHREHPRRAALRRGQRARCRSFTSPKPW